MSACSVIAVPWHCTCLYVSCHGNARLTEDVGLVKVVMYIKACDHGECLLRLLTEPKPDEHEPHAHKECGGKAKGKGKPLRVPQVDEDNGPKWIREGSVPGYKLWVGDLPDHICKKDIGHYCAGRVDVAVERGKATSGLAYAIVTFTDLALASKAFEQLAMVRFDHGEGQRFWANVKWFRGKPLANV